MHRRPFLFSAALLLALAVFPRHLAGQALSGAALVNALRSGGYVIVMRHASAPRDLPTKETAAPGNTKLERQLDEAGRANAAAMGKALRDLKIPIGEVAASPTYRALETIRYAQWPNPKPYAELGDGGQGMAPTSESQGDWLKKKAGQAPNGGSNTIIVTHSPNMSQAFPQSTVGLGDGEALVVAPDRNGGAVVVARVKIEEWPNLKP